MIDILQEKWMKFKRARTKDPYLNIEDDDFITVIERENIIDLLFEYIKKGLNEKDSP